MIRNTLADAAQTQSNQQAESLRVEKAKKGQFGAALGQLAAEQAPAGAKRAWMEKSETRRGQIQKVITDLEEIEKKEARDKILNAVQTALSGAAIVLAFIPGPGTLIAGGLCAANGIISLARGDIAGAVLSIIPYGKVLKLAASPLRALAAPLFKAGAAVLGDAGRVVGAAMRPAVSAAARALCPLLSKVGILICFVGDTAVLVGSPDDPTAMVARRIDEIQVGDLVWTRPQDNPDAPLELRPVTSVERHVVYELRHLSIADGSGNVENLTTTDPHPFYSLTRNAWVEAGQLQVGEEMLSDDGRVMTVTASVGEARPEGVAVYNFTVEGDHTYFVSDGQGEESWVWVHNSCELHHLFTRALGSLIPYGKSFLQKLSHIDHREMHDELKAYLKNVHLPDGRWADLFARKGLSGEAIRKAFTATERIAVLDKFYQGFKQGKFLQAFRDEVVYAFEHGLIQ